MRFTAFMLAGVVLIILSACYPVRRAEPLVGPMTAANASVKRGEQLFNANCFSCHPGGEGGLAPSLNDKPLPRIAMRFQIRHGLGAMPAFNEQQLSDQEVENIVDYIVALRHHVIKK
jgi:mono/diheme cytochrome c family protein